MFKRIFQWNRHRNNLDYNQLHEEKMLHEEVMEYLEATNKANEAKELADIIFVAVGSLGKLVGYRKAQAIMEIVMTHNEAKVGEKVNGKVTKLGVDWKAEDRIKEILDQERPIQTTMDSYLYDNEHIYKGDK